jgi:hypothetical protein
MEGNRGVNVLLATPRVVPVRAKVIIEVEGILVICRYLSRGTYICGRKGVPVSEMKFSHDQIMSALSVKLKSPEEFSTLTRNRL